MKNTNKRTCIALLLLILFLFPACGKPTEPDGIDSVTILSDLTKPETSSSDDQEISGDPSDLNTILHSPLARFHEYSFSSSLYLLFVMDALESTASRYDVELSSASGFDVMLEDGSVMTAEEYCRFYADSEFTWACLLSASVFESGHELNECRSYSDVSRQAYSLYQSKPSLYSKLSVSLDDLILFCLYPALYEDLFFMRFGQGGDCEISLDALQELMENNQGKLLYTYLPFYDDQTQERFSDETIRELTDLSEEYLERFRQGEPFEEIVSENYMYLDAFHVVMDPQSPEIYYSPYDPGLPPAIIECAESLQPYEAGLLVTEDFTSVVQRLPVNGTIDDIWYERALSLAYESEYGEQYAEAMTIAYDSADIVFDEEIHQQLTAHFYSAQIMDQD